MYYWMLYISWPILVDWNHKLERRLLPREARVMGGLFTKFHAKIPRFGVYMAQSLSHFFRIYYFEPQAPYTTFFHYFPSK